MKKIQPEPQPGQKTNIDGSEIKNRISPLPEALNQKIFLPPEEKRALLKTRAQALAVENKDESAQKEIIEIVVFRLASETYGIESKYIREVYPLKDFTILPGTPPFVLGIMNVRGQIISVIDLKIFFHLPEKGLGELNKVIIVRNQGMEFGILADIIRGMRSIPIEEIQTPPVSTSGIGLGFLRGVSDDHIIILDAARILEDKTIIIHQEAV